MHLKIKVIPRAKKTEVLGRMSDGTLKIRLKAIPEKGMANEVLCAFLAEELALDKSQIQIVSGFSDTRKLVKISSLNPLPW